MVAVCGRVEALTRCLGLRVNMPLYNASAVVKQVSNNTSSLIAGGGGGGGQKGNETAGSCAVGGQDIRQVEERKALRC